MSRSFIGILLLFLSFSISKSWAQTPDSLLCPNSEIRDTFDSTHKRYHYYRVENLLLDKKAHPEVDIKSVFHFFCSDANFVAPLSGKAQSEVISCNITQVKIGPTRKNPILTCVDTIRTRLINYSLPGHFLHPGKVVRAIVEDEEKISIVTESWGYGKLPKLNERKAEKNWQKIDYRLKEALEQELGQD